MATIVISDLHPAGSDLFFDSESYMNEMSEEITSIIGGGSGFWCGVGAGLAKDAAKYLIVDVSSPVCAAVAVGAVAGALVKPKPAY